MRKDDGLTTSLFQLNSTLSSSYQSISSDLGKCWSELLLVILVASFFSALVIFSLRWFAGVIVWSILISTILFGFILACFFAFKVATSRYANERTIYVFAMTFSAVIAMFFTCIIFIVRHKIKLVIQLFKEASKVVADVPLILLQPFAVRYSKPLIVLFKNCLP